MIGVEEVLLCYLRVLWAPLCWRDVLRDGQRDEGRACA